MNKIGFLEAITEVVYEAGEILKSAVAIEDSIEEKSGRANFVTAYDKKVQEFLFEKLAEVLPEAVFIGEEEEEHAALSEGYAFIIDPIDGTTNFMKGYNASCISVGLLKDGQPDIAVVYNPYLNEMYQAMAGQGAFCNGKQIKVSEHPLSEGLVLFGSAPYNEELAEKSFALAYQLFNKSLDIRRSGSAAFDLCNIAAGRAEFFFEMQLSPWDYAAGTLLVKEAGGLISDMDGMELVFDKKCSVMAGNADAMEVYRQLMEENKEENHEDTSERA
ncbi:MAG: inositol monophosphatase [Lachnospiraceae bacterium]|nr:inositol monophosphatase [Lachnospiraceae bacterium]